MRICVAGSVDSTRLRLREDAEESLTSVVAEVVGRGAEGTDLGGKSPDPEAPEVLGLVRFNDLT